MYVLGPADIETRVLGYRSIPGRFGLTGLFALWGAKGLLDVWPRVFEIIYGTGWLLLGLWLWSKDTLDKRTLVTIAAASLIVLPTFGPGSGLHYIYWFLPLLILLHGLAEHRMRMFLTVMYLAAAVAYTLEYALNFNTYGAFFLDIVQTGPLLKLGLKLSTLKGETLVTLPLAILYAGFVAQCGQKIGGEMIRDFLVLWRQTHVFHRSERHDGKPAHVFSLK